MSDDLVNIYLAARSNGTLEELIQREDYTLVHDELALEFAKLNDLEAFEMIKPDVEEMVTALSSIIRHGGIDVAKYIFDLLKEKYGDSFHSIYSFEFLEAAVITQNIELIEHFVLGVDDLLECREIAEEYGDHYMVNKIIELKDSLMRS